MHSGSMNNCVISCAQYQPLFDGMVAFPSLEVLSMWDLEHTVTDIWGKHYSDDNNKTVSSSFGKLKSLKVHECDKLKSVIPIAMLHRLRNLEYLYIENCRNLRNAFPPCISRDLIHLKRMHISWCGMMREIIGEGENKEEEIIDDHPDHGIIVFPELTELKLVDLENLTSFWCYQSGDSYTYKVEFPSLVKLELRGCGEINLESIKFSRDESTCALKSISIKTKKRVQLPCKWKTQLHNLKSLTLYRCWWHDLVSLCFPKLEELYVVDCGCPALFTISGFISLQQLRKLEISECALLEEIVEDVRCDEHAVMDTKTIKLWQLDSVVLRDLPNLISFIHIANYECYMPALKKVEVDNCGLSSLFTCSVLRNLQNLETLVVSNCQLLEGVVEDGRGDESSDTNDQIITLFQLSKVTLEDLPNLKSFSRTVSYAFNMPKLESFCLLWCPQLEYFSYLKTSTGLVSVVTEWNTWEEIEDLNDYIMQNRVKVSNQERETESGMVEEHPLDGN